MKNPLCRAATLQGGSASTQHHKGGLQLHYSGQSPERQERKGYQSMKQIVKMSRLTGLLEKAFNLLNADWFDGRLETPIITVIPTPRAYAHYTTVNVWDTANGARREINVASGSLDRSLEEIIASLMHEMVHMWNDMILNIQDTSRNGSYHNRLFAIEAEKHGLTVEKSSKYGYAFRMIWLNPSCP